MRMHSQAAPLFARTQKAAPGKVFMRAVAQTAGNDIYDFIYFCAANNSFGNAANIQVKQFLPRQRATYIVEEQKITLSS